MQGHRRRRETKRSPETPIRPKGWGGTGPSLCCSSSPMSRHRLVVAPRSGLRRAPNKRYRIDENEYLGVKPLLGGLPVDEVPPVVHVLGSTVLVLEIVSMLPDIQAENGHFTLHQGTVLIGC